MPELKEFDFSKLVLGSVQFGMHYGISNQDGSPENEELNQILDFANQIGVQIIDTASAYGSAEERLGIASKQFKIVSKIRPGTAATDVQEELESSLNRLEQEQLYGLLLHSFDDYQKDQSIWAALKEMKAQGKVERIGFSLYKPEQLKEVMENGHIPDLIQVPFNLYDRRFQALSELITRNKIEVHVRSAFLQGLFFFEADQLPGYFDPITQKQEKFRKLCTTNTKVISTAINFILSQHWVSKVLVGVNSTGELKGIEESLLNEVPISMESLNFMEESDEAMINPSLW